MVSATPLWRCSYADKSCNSSCAGCLECRHRRIYCDRTEPACRKCLKKRIKCSGQGIECRFSSYMRATPSEKRRASQAPKSTSTTSATSTTLASLSSQAREHPQNRRRMTEPQRDSPTDNLYQDTTRQSAEVTPASAKIRAFTFADNVTIAKYEQTVLGSVQLSTAVVRSDPVSARTQNLIQHCGFYSRPFFEAQNLMNSWTNVTCE